LRVFGPSLERHQRLFEGAEVLSGLGEERLEQEVAIAIGQTHGHIFLTHAVPSPVWKTSLRPCAPPTSSATIGTPASASSRRARSTFFMPSDSFAVWKASMTLAPPKILALSRARGLPSLARSSRRR